MFDSHCHLTDTQFADDLDDVLARAWNAGLTGIVSIASDARDALLARDLARTDPRLHSTAGVHPHAAAEATAADLDVIRELVRAGRVVAVGETGLDFHYDNSPRDVQRRLFEAHLELAASAPLPVVVHSRSCDDVMADMIRSAPGVRGVLHCFTGTAQLLETALAAGWFMSFGGIVTFRNFAGADLLRTVPDDRLLLETDSPYLAPVPYRGRRNEPAFVTETCRVIAALRGTTADALAGLTTANAHRFYGLADGVARP
jgi:TatD DNase family protein